MKCHISCHSSSSKHCRVAFYSSNINAYIRFVGWEKGKRNDGEDLEEEGSVTYSSGFETI